MVCVKCKKNLGTVVVDGAITPVTVCVECAGEPKSASIDWRSLDDSRRGPQLPPPAPPIADMVNRPPHYKQGSIEVIDIIEGAKLGFHLGNAVKYILRAEHKGKLEDIKKARWYLDRYIESV